MSAHRYVVLDVFTDTPLQGNPLAVFTDGDSLSGEQMQALARELNLSETAFLLTADTDADARVRIFTPATELPFAGHPVLGSALVIAERAAQRSVKLQTGAGEVPVHFDPPFGEMLQPLPTEVPPPDEAQVLGALGIADSELPIKAYSNGPHHIYVGLPNEDAVRALRPDLSALAKLGQCCFSCFAVTAKGKAKTRVFCPGLGVPEDPATGSAAGPLALHLVANNRLRFGERLELHQGEELGRSSVLFAQADGTPEHLEAIKVGGSAVEVARGEFRVT